MKKLIPISCLLFLFLPGWAQTAEILKKLNQNLSTASSDTQRTHILSDAVWDIQVKDPSLADSVAAAEIRYGEACGYPKYQADAYNDAGAVKYRLGDFAKCKEYYLKSLDIRTRFGDEAGIGSCMGKLGALYQKMGDLDKALECQLQCLHVQEKLHNQINIAVTYNNIAVIHNNQKNPCKAIEYARKALDINIQLSNAAGTVTNYNTLATAYLALGKYDSTLLLLDSVVAVADRRGDKFSKASAYCNIGNAYEHQKDSVQALQYYIRALNMAKETNSKAAISMYSQNIGYYYVAKAQYDSAEYYLLTAYNTAKELNQKPVLYMSSLGLYNIYKRRGDLLRATKYVEESIAEKDSVYNEESSKQIAEMQTKYETEKKEQQLSIQQLQLNRRNIILIVLSLIFILSAVIGWLTYNRYKLKQKTILDAEILSQQQQRAKAVIEAEEHERQRIGKDLHDGVGQILSAAKLNLSALQSKIPMPEQSEKDMMQNALDLIDESVKEVRTISHNMMPNMLIKSGLASAVRDFVNKMTATDKLKIDLDLVGMNKRLDATVETVLFRVFQEIINNIIRHSEAGHVTIQLVQHEQEIVMMIEDNGKGFDVSKTISGEGGIGLKSITSRVEYLHGSIHIDSMPGRGTTVTIEIPNTP